MTKLPSVLVHTNRITCVQKRLTELVERYAELHSQLKPAKAAYREAERIDEELFIAVRDLEKVDGWEEMKDDLFAIHQAAETKMCRLAEVVEDIETELTEIDQRTYDAYFELRKTY
jgi:chaperonin cofactor prefoldin